MVETAATRSRVLGARILSEANDLKRTPGALAADLGLEPALVDDAIAGRGSVENAESILRQMVETYPISLCDVWIDEDDTDDGCRLIRNEESAATGRKFDRLNAQGGKSIYYEYRDTAMSKLAPFKPEWIQPLRYVEDADPDNPDVAYNKGHLMHQMTFFIGDVNFYWTVEGKNYCAEMVTGDSNYVTPFVPHSFTSRTPGKPGLIIAITYGGEVRHAMSDFGRVGADGAEALSGDLRDLKVAYRARLSYLMSAESLTEDELAVRLTEIGLDRSRAEGLACGSVIPEEADRNALADVLSCRPGDISLSSLSSDQEVVVRRVSESRIRAYPNSNNVCYRLSELARTPHQPTTKIFGADIVGPLDPDAGALRHGLHEYVYNYGDAPVDMAWGDGRVDKLMPGDSAYFMPYVSHSFGRIDGEGEGKLAIARISGKLTLGAITEFASFDANGRQRAVQENTQWF